uniref:Anaphase-promoting complex subunit 5 n=4 Tax=Lygus hesperus TaxID=30085 RepID=A0A0A9Y630_LYGHE
MVNSESSSSHDIWTFKDVKKSSVLEYVTPYKICVVVLINEMCALKSKNRESIPTRRILFRADKKPIYRRDFCMLMLKLIQSPDMDFTELVKLLESGKYQIQPELIENFKIKVEELLERDVGCSPDVLTNVERLPHNELNGYELINRSSKIGLFLRRVQLFFEKLSFSQMVATYKAYQSYILSRKRPARESKDLSDSEDLEETKENRPFRRKSVEEMELSSICADTSLSIRLSPNEASHISELGGAQPPVGLWSRRQAELFMAQQAKHLMEDPKSALPPPDLQNKLKDVIRTNPEQAEAHFLSYLNCLRVKEYCGAVDSLFHYFDRKVPSSFEDDAVRCKGLRYAALNLAILQAHFNKKNEALCALTEAITLAHEANDNVCLQHAQAWLYKLQAADRDILIQRSISKCEELNLNYLSSFGLQTLAEYAAKKGDPPSQVFEMLSRSDVINMQYSQMDLLLTSLGMFVALWSMYGRSDLAALAAQQLLHLDPIEKCQTLTHGDSLILAVTCLVNYFANQGEYGIGWALVDHGRQRAPDSKWWLWAENVLYFIESLHKGQWQHAHLAVNQLSTVDKQESLLRLSELLLMKGDRQGALSYASAVLKEPYSNPVTYVRALHLSAKAHPKGAVTKLGCALELANYHYIDYWKALITLEIANIQVEMGLGFQALKLVDKTLLDVLCHGCFFDTSDALFLYAECKVITANTANRFSVIHEAIRILDRAAQLAKHVENYCKVKKIVYLQAILCNNVGLTAERNKYAYEFRILDEQFPTTDSPLHSIQ